MNAVRKYWHKRNWLVLALTLIAIDLSFIAPKWVASIERTIEGTPHPEQRSSKQR